MPANPPALFPDRQPVWRELDELLSAPEFATDTDGVAATYHRLQALGRTLGPARALHHQPGRMLAGMEWAGIVDPAMMHAAMVHFGVATTAFMDCGHPNPDLAPLLDDLDALRAPGVIVATELGRGGSQMRMRTEARYNPDRDNFTLTTPDDAALKFMPNVSWTGLDRAAVVNARLIHNGTDHGVHAFACRLPHPQVRVTSIPGGGQVNLDFSLLRFDQAEIPAGWWLADTATMTDGELTDPCTPHQRLARSLGGVNAAVTSATVAMTAAARACIAITYRFQVQRLTGPTEAPAINLPAHSGELASAVARVFAATAYSDTVRDHYIAESIIADPDDDASYAPWLAANRDRTLAKVHAATTLEQVAGTCRRLCGAHGTLSTNRLTTYEGMARSFHAAGGDTRLLLLEAGKQLAAHGTDATGNGQGHSPRQLLAFQERVLVSSLGPDPALADVEYLAGVHLARRALETLDDLVAAHPGHFALLDPVRRLYGLDLAVDTAAWHLNYGSLRPGDLDRLQCSRAAARDHVTSNLTALVDALAVPPGRAGGAIGRRNYIRHAAAHA
ncbi:hypothetical protein ACL03H_01390 [Saccharopolyspora sp. MS10]|uniref:acyl-CoA dehydrogenase family protein n=1 Tax=Saccharopolyspora sp. MS10 TaxID=3385973 RepID=UPI0039A2FA1B